MPCSCRMLLFVVSWDKYCALPQWHEKAHIFFPSCKRNAYQVRLPPSEMSTQPVPGNDAHLKKELFIQTVTSIVKRTLLHNTIERRRPQCGNTLQTLKLGPLLEVFFLNIRRGLESQWLIWLLNLWRNVHDSYQKAENRSIRLTELTRSDDRCTKPHRIMVRFLVHYLVRTSGRKESDWAWSFPIR